MAAEGRLAVVAMARFAAQNAVWKLSSARRSLNRPQSRRGARPRARSRRSAPGRLVPRVRRLEDHVLEAHLGEAAEVIEDLGTALPVAAGCRRRWARSRTSWRSSSRCRRRAARRPRSDPAARRACVAAPRAHSDPGDLDPLGNVEQVAGIRVLRDQAQGLPALPAAHEDRRVRPLVAVRVVERVLQPIVRPGNGVAVARPHLVGEPQRLLQPLVALPRGRERQDRARASSSCQEAPMPSQARPARARPAPSGT